MQVPVSNALARLGTLSFTLNDEARPGWLKPDGVTEYNRASYPAFVIKFGAAEWFLAGSTAAKFKLLDVRGLAFVMAGGGVRVGKVTGVAEYKLTSANMPEHDHTYDKPSLGTEMSAGVISQILGGVLTTLKIPQPKVTTAQATGKTGTTSPTAIPITPKSLGVNVFIFAGLPQG
ncbi:microcystin-dependent protein [Rhizobium skierniewicense]|uniref:Microcystin-dependent protein n=1 Tax=Rhizobium skierniewicense TaxID=984260 RepID=A0A7W6C8I8_9HYPH|nr:hypothetical protein [Rhizobium skierniewicense]MBB3947697.1 microcystin-dependent protein [Rhizobium skierniewicense]